MSLRTRLSIGVVALAVAACGEMATLPISAGMVKVCWTSALDEMTQE